MNNQQAFELIQRIVYDESGMRLAESKLYLVETRLASFCREEKCANIGELMTKLGTLTPALVKRIVEAMTTNETWWFRDNDLYEAFTKVLFPELVRRKLQANQFEILLWSAACSTGQEVYSLKMIWEKFKPQAKGVNLKILATDIDSQVLQRARDGKFTQLEVGRGLPTMDLMMNFEQSGTDWKVSDHLKANIEWKQASLMNPPPILGVADIVLCRNVLIYFDDDGKRQILGNIRRALRPEGLLFIGGSESIFALNTDYRRISVAKVFAYGSEAAEQAAQSLKPA